MNSIAAHATFDSPTVLLNCQKRRHRLALFTHRRHNPATATLAGLTGEQISGDLLTATIWSWFAAAESHNRLSQNQANMIENQGLSYGLFHAIAQPIYSWGVVRAVKFPGVNMDIGHIRPIGWSKDNDRNTWIAYNKLRGQYMSALEHAIPERFFNDPSKCNPDGTTTPIAGLPACPQGISAVKAIGLAAAQGQKIYTISPEVYRNNPSIVNTNLGALSQSTKQGIQNALDAGNEVTAHESPITQSGWTGAGYIFTDPQTGAGGYIIDGGSNGAFLAIVMALLFISLLSLPISFVFLTLSMTTAATVASALGFVATVMLVLSGSDLINPTILALLRFFTVMFLFVTFPLTAPAAIVASQLALIFAGLGSLIAGFRGAFF